MADTALLSVYNKEGIVEFAAGLVDLGWTVMASGGTAAKIKEAGIPVTDVAKLAGGKAILGHRVVTLSREVYAGILADTSSPADMKELKKLNIPVIGLVCVDMYPLEAEIAKSKPKLQDIITQTDIGGPTMLRAAAKSRRIVLSVAEQRKQVLKWLRHGKPDEAAFLEELAARAEYEVTRYTLPLAMYLGGDQVTGSIARLNAPAKYGENPQQAQAAFYSDNRVKPDSLGLDKFKHVQGTVRSFINMTDIDRLLQTATHIAAGFERNFKKVPPLAVGVKHGNACGAAVGKTPAEAVAKMLEGDTRAIFGGVVMINAPIDKKVADTLLHHAMNGKQSRLLDGVVGSSVTKEALATLTRQKLRVVVNPALAKLGEKSLDNSRRSRPVRGGSLVQPNYTYVTDFKADYMQEYGTFTQQERKDLILAWAVGSTSNSNTITLVKNGQLIGNGVGQQDRVGAGQLALSRTTIAMPELKNVGSKFNLIIKLDKTKLKGAVAYSDSFFPFPDGPSLLADAGITAILTSSGSVADKTVIDALTKKGVRLVMVPDTMGRGFYAH